MKTLVLLLALCGVANAQVKMNHVYGSSGEYEGRVVTYPNGTQMYYGSKGEPEGRSVTAPSGATNYWGGRGEYRGRSTGAPSSVALPPAADESEDESEN